MSNIAGADMLALRMSPPHSRTSANHQSNSLPSSPYQRARKLSLNARSPSPEKTVGTPSPTAHSEAGDILPSRGKGPLLAGCKYETGMAYSRRRIPYSFGGDQLPRANKMPKKYLNPAEEAQLSGDMRELYDRLYPSLDGDDRRSKFVKKLADILNKQWPGNDIKVHVFGSSGNLLCTDDSDVDICITTPLKALERVCLLAKALGEHGMERVVCVPYAKVPIVKFWDPDLQLACDMNVNNTLALENTRMIKTYVEIDQRVRPLAMIIKHWTRRRILNDAAFADDIVSLRGFGQKNKESLGELLFHFFRRCGHELDYERNVISIREGTLISKEDKKWHLMHNNRLCVEEPFNTERNLGNTADDISFRGVHTELRRAFDLISEAKLDQCMEQYVYPAVEEKIWEKPPPKPPPVLSRSQSQSGRGGRGGTSNRGGRYTLNQHRNGQQGRRASSAAASNKFVNAPTMPRTAALWEQPLQASYDQYRLHEKLLNDYQLLQAQEHELRRVQAQAQLQAQLQVHGQGPLTAPLRANSASVAYSPSTMTRQQTLHSHPPSPSLQSAQPELRRSVHRSVNTTNSSSAQNRSHSQPPMLSIPSSQGLYLNGLQLQQYQQLRSQQFYGFVDAQGRLRHPELVTPSPFPIDPRFEENMPKEYVGYYVHDSPSLRPSHNEVGLPRAPTLNDIAQHSRNMPRGLPRLEDPPNPSSPTPMLPHRDRSTSMLSASSAPPGPMQDRVHVPNPSLRTSGPIIVDGSDAWATNENALRIDLPSDKGMTNGTPQISLVHSNRSTLMEEQHPRSGRAETIASMPFRQQYPRQAPNSAHNLTESTWSSNLEPKPRRVYPQVNGTAPAPVTIPSQPEIVNGYGLGIENHRAASPQRDIPAASPTRSPSATRKESVAEGPALNGLPLLSPVREVRTPSPTAKRKDDRMTEVRPPKSLAQMYMVQAIPAFSRKREARDKQAEQQSHETNGLSVGSSGNLPITQLANGWQQTPSKKHKKSKSKGNVPPCSDTPLREPMPANEAERKGG